MRILYLGSHCLSGHFLQLYQDVTQEGHTLFFYPLRKRKAELLKKFGSEKKASFWLSDEIIKEERMNNVDSVVIWKHIEEITVDLFEILKKDGVKIIVYTLDSVTGEPDAMYTDVKKLEYVDCVLVADENALPLLDDIEVKGKWYPVGYSPKLFYPTSSDKYLMTDVLFTANTTYPPSEYVNNKFWRVDLIEALIDVGVTNISIYGRREDWLGAKGKKELERFVYESIKMEEVNRYNNSCKVLLNSGVHQEGKGYYSNRLIHGLGSGAFVLSDSPESLKKVFKIGEHLETYDSIEELQKKARHYLDDEKERREIAKNGYEFAIENLTWAKVFEKYFEPELT